MTKQVLSVSNLCIDAVSDTGVRKPIVQDVSFTVGQGEVIALIGESGSGKTTISLSALGYFKPGCHLISGSVVLDDIDLMSLTEDQIQQLRGTKVAYVAQSAAASFNPALKLDRQVTEVPVTRLGVALPEALRKAETLYAKLELPQPKTIGRRYPHQVSGGQLQRLMAAMAMINEPMLLILDEPTTALDVTTQIEVLRAFKALIAEKGVSVIYVTHDLALVAQIANKIIVLKDGCVVECGSVDEIIHRPTAAYTQKLIGAAHVMPEEIALSSHSDIFDKLPIFEMKHVSAGYGFPGVLAVDDVSFSVRAGEIIGVIGESGSGKTTLGRIVSGLMHTRGGELTLNGKKLLQGIENRKLEDLRNIQFAYQMADVALNPRHTIRKILSRPLEFYFGLTSAERNQELERLLYLVSLPKDILSSVPSELSGGQKQRVNLARALAARPQLIICDEITSALDTIVSATILDTIDWLRDELKVAFLFITHDISIIAKIADSVMVMRYGCLVESGRTKQVLGSPDHAYTKLLLSSVPQMRTDWLDGLTPPPSSVNV